MIRSSALELRSRKITEHFWFTEASGTMHKDLIAENEEAAVYHIEAITAQFQIMERIRWGLVHRDKLCDWVDVDSMFRGDLLNSRVGGVRGSQHSYGGASDFGPNGKKTEDRVKACYNSALKTLSEEKIMFGDLIFERKFRTGRKPAFWVHVSLGWPWMPLDKCREVLIMTKVPGKRAEYDFRGRLSLDPWRG